MPRVLLACVCVRAFACVSALAIAMLEARVRAHIKSNLNKNYYAYAPRTGAMMRTTSGTNDAHTHISVAGWCVRVLPFSCRVDRCKIGLRCLIMLCFSSFHHLMNHSRRKHPFAVSAHTHTPSNLFFSVRTICI